MRELEYLVDTYIEKMNLFGRGTHVLAGVSGGADSVCLLAALCALREKWDLKLTVLHVEHGIRGEESLEDMEFVQRLCAAWGVPFRGRQVDASEKARKEHLSLEEAARLLRHAALEETADAVNADCIALGHHMEDNAETILFHLVRGSGLQGLTGIPAVRGRIVRPLLEVSRAQIEAYLKEIGQEWRQDVTNDDPYYARNRIRTRVLPELELVNSGAARHLTETAARLQTVRDFLDQMTNQALDAVTVSAPEEEWLVDTAAFCGLHPAVQERLLHRLLETAAGSSKDLGAVHIGILRDLLLGTPGRAADLPYGLRAEAEQGRLRLYQKASAESGRHDFALSQGSDCGAPDEKNEESDQNTGEEQGSRSAEGQNSITDSEWSMDLLTEPAITSGREGSLALPEGRVLRWRVFDFAGEKIPVKTYTKWFDYDKIKNRLCVRTRRRGDFLTVTDDGGRKKLKDWMINEKIPASERDRIFLLADGAHILWVIGQRISAHYKVTGATRTILEVCIDAKGVGTCMN